MGTEGGVGGVSGVGMGLALTASGERNKPGPFQKGPAQEWSSLESRKG